MNPGIKSRLHQAEKDDVLPLIEKLSFEKDRYFSYNSTYAKLVFIIDGSFLFTLDNKPDFLIRAGQLLFIPPHTPFRLYVLENVSLILNRISDCVGMCNQMGLTKKDWTVPSLSCSCNPLPIKPATELFISSLSGFLEDGLSDRDFHELKLEELYYILKHYYTKEELKRLFHPVLSRNFTFANFVLTNYMKVRTAKELAKLSHYSISGFEKEFKNVFEVSPYHWMLERKSKKIYHEIKNTNKPLKNIAEEFGFVNLSQLCDFSRRHFKTSPGKIRKNAGNVE
ncbi:MAG: helix-turn-helix domain-containing protein [Tannerellaceae bacterium]|nr:helix-turn-helix domain-containing protein [Tannerellaceae bacterium]